MAVTAQKLHAVCRPQKYRQRFQDGKNINLLSELTDVPEDILKELNKQRHDPMFCDVTITTNDGGSFQAHKRVLSSCSPYLEKKLSFLGSENTGKKGKATIHLGMISSKSCEILLEVLYTSKLSLTKENAGEVLLAAQVLDLQTVSALCRHMLRCDVVSKMVTKEIESQDVILLAENRKHSREFEEQDGEVFEDRDPDSPTKSAIHQDIERWSVADNDNNEESPKSTSQRPSSLSNLPSHNIVDQIAHRPLSAPGSSTRSSNKFRSVPVTNRGIPLGSDDYDHHVVSPLDLSRTDRNIDGNTQQMKNEGFRVRNEGSIRLKLKSELQFFPESNKDHQYPTATVGYAKPHHHIVNPLPMEASHVSPLLHRRTSAETFRSNQALKDQGSEDPRNVVARIRQPPMQNSSFLLENSNFLGLYQQAPALWAYMMQSEALSPKSWYRTDQDQVSLNYQSYLSKELHRPKSIASPPVTSCKLCGTEYMSEWQFFMHLRFCRYGGYIYPPNLLHSKLREESCYDRTDLKKVPTAQAKFPFDKPRQSEEVLNNYDEERVKTAMIFMKNGVSTKIRHKCYHCKKDFDSIFLLRKHKSMEHVKRPHRCHICQAAFPNKAGLSVHVRSHTGERPYRCKICNKAFTQLGHVQRHQKVHTGEKPYQCPLCKARVRDKASMHYHLLAHQGVKPFHCDQCDARFTKRSSLVKHKNVHTGSHLYQCPQCKASFREKASLSRHVRSQHKDSYVLDGVKTIHHSY